MFSGISWVQYIRTIFLVVLVYYLVIGIVYYKSLLQWWKRDKNGE
jgi:hypothetical protein